MSVTIETELKDDILELAKEDHNRSLSSMAAILLRFAVKEKKRKRNGSKKNHSSDNSADEC